MKTKEGKPVSVKTAKAIDNLGVALIKEFGCDFAYTIMGRGHILAASSLAHGTITAKVAVEKKSN